MRARRHKKDVLFLRGQVPFAMLDILIKDGVVVDGCDPTNLIE